MEFSAMIEVLKEGSLSPVLEHGGKKKEKIDMCRFYKSKTYGLKVHRKNAKWYHHFG